MYDISKKSCAQGLHFFCTPKSFEQFMGMCYDPKTENGCFACKRVISSHRIMCSASIESSYQMKASFFVLTATSFEQYI